MFRWMAVVIEGYRVRDEVRPRGRDDQVPMWSPADEEGLVRRIRRLASINGAPARRPRRPDRTPSGADARPR